MSRFDPTTLHPQLLGGRACIRGMRIPVSGIVKRIAHGATWKEALHDYPDLEPEDMQAALEYAAWRTAEEVRTAQGMRILAAMGVSRGGVVVWLRQQGHDATHLGEEGLGRLPDPQIFSKAAVEQRVLLTLDLDFGEIVALSSSRLVSVVLLRLNQTPTPFVIERLGQVLPAASRALQLGAVVLVEDGRHRVRRPPGGWRRPVGQDDAAASTRSGAPTS